MAEVNPSGLPAGSHAGGLPPDGPQLRLEDLILAHHAAVYRYAFRLSGSAADAEDVTQQTFLIAHEKLPHLREAERAAAWLFTIARTCYLKARAKRMPEASNDELTELTQPMPLIDEVDRDELQQALSDLPSDLRLVLVMYYFEDLSYREIAQELEIAVGTVMSRLSRAKDRLRQRLATRFPKSALLRKPAADPEMRTSRHAPTKP